MRTGKSVLADTCVWIDFLKAAPVSADCMEELIESQNLCVCGPVLFELLQGIRSETEQKRILDALGGLHYIEMSPAVWQYAAGLSAQLKRTGVSVPYSDLIIAALAHHYNLTIHTYDRHFTLIPGVELYLSV